MTARRAQGVQQRTTARYRRQIAFAPFGEAGQQALGRATVLVVGCGGLGSAAASALVRAGLGQLRLLDPDRVELDNLHRQILYDEADLGAPKAEVAGRRLRAIDSGVIVEAQAEALAATNVDRWLAGVSLVVDATDNLAARYLINDGCLRHGLPWIYGGVDGASGMVLTVLPGRGPCFCCLFPPAAETAGDEPAATDRGGAVLGPLPALVAAVQVIEACRLLAGVDLQPALLRFDLWEQTWQRIEVARDERCVACGG